MSSFCHYYDQNICRSCDLLPVAYPEQVASKEEQLRQSLAIAPHLPLLPTRVGALLGFRNKVKMSVAGTTEAPVIGLLSSENLDLGKELLDCPVHHPKLNVVLQGLKKFITQAKIVPYQVSQKRGELKGIICFYSAGSDEMYVRLVLRSTESIERIKKHSASLLTEFPSIACLTVNLQPIPHAILEGDEEIFIAGSPTIHHRLGEIEFALRPKAFVQTNQALAQNLYETAAAWMKEINTSKLAELFCGQGAFSFFAKDTVKEALGIEINAEAVAGAQAMASQLHLSHLHFKAADAAQVVEELRTFQPDTVLVNPPRKGLGKSIALFKEHYFPYLIYSSCDHRTLAQDLAQLPQYEIQKIQIFDLFPHTHHFETLVLLKKI